MSSVQRASTSRAAIAAIAPVLRTNHNVITTRQARAVGVEGAMLRRLAAGSEGPLQRRARGVYVSLTAPARWETEALVAQRRVEPHGVLSHWAAARILGLPRTAGTSDTPIETTAPRGGRRPTGIDHESEILGPTDVIRVGPFRVTGPTFTLGALGTRMGPERLAKAIDAALAEARTDLTALRDLAIRMWHTPGVVHLREALLLVSPITRLTRSERERLFGRICVAFDLPLPEANVRVIDASGRVRYLDFAYVEWLIMLEIDSHPSHLRHLGRSQDGSRQNGLVPTWIPLRFDDDDLVRRPEYVAGEVRRVLLERGATW